MDQPVLRVCPIVQSESIPLVADQKDKEYDDKNHFDSLTPPRAISKVALHQVSTVSCTEPSEEFSNIERQEDTDKDSHNQSRSHKITVSAKHVLVLASLGPGSGNNATASRIAFGLRQLPQVTVDLLSIDAPNIGLDSLQELIYQYDIVLALHVYRAGRLLTSIYENNSDLPALVFIFAGTDLHSCEPEWLPTIKQMLPKARGLVCFSTEWKKYVEHTYKDLLTCPITVIPQGVPLPSSTTSASFSRKTIIWAGQIRSVKDPLFAVRIMSYLTNHEFLLIIVGYETDNSLFNALQSLSSRSINVKIIGGQSTDEVHALMRSAFAYLNTSINEGMCLAILEAMSLHLPVVARRNTGNTSIVTHGKTGLLYETPEQATQCLLQLESDINLRTTLIQQAADQVETVHNPISENKAYQNLIISLLE